MKRILFAAFAVAGLLLTLVPSAPLLAEPIDFGTNIHLWVLRCPGSAKIVSGHPCPNNPPAGCYCVRTRHDFPYDHPYGVARVSIGNEDENPGVIQVMVDHEGAIQCGASVHPSPAADSCGAEFGVEPLDGLDVDPGILDEVDSRLGSIEEATAHPVEEVRYSRAYAFDP